MSDFLTGKNFVLVPRVTTPERNSLVATNGMLVYDTSLNLFYKYENGSWSSFAGGGAAWGGITGTLSNQTDLSNALNAKQDTLVSGTNIKTVNSNSLLGSGDVSIIASPAGSDKQVQFNDGGVLGADSHFTYDKTNDVLHVHKIAGDATDGLIIESENGTDVGVMGMANTANVTWYGSHNYDIATANTIASFGASKTLSSLSTSTYPSLTELSYVKGVTSALQTQINAKADLASPVFTGTPTAPTVTDLITGTTQLATVGYVNDIHNPQKFSNLIDEDFVMAHGFTAANSGTGSAPTYDSVAALTNAVGVYSLKTGTTTTGSSRIIASNQYAIKFGIGKIIMQSRLLLSALSDGTDTYSCLFGFSDSASSGGVGTEGAYFTYTHSVNSGNWVCVTKVGSVSTTTNTATAASTSFADFGIEVNAAGTQIIFTINSVTVATHTTNLPVNAGFASWILKSAGTTSRSLSFDYIKVYAQFTSLR